MLCSTATIREINRALYRLQYVYENGHAETIDKYPELFMAVVSKTKHRAIIEDERYIIDPTRQVLETEDTIFYFPKQEFDILYILRSARGKPLHQEIIRGAILTKDKKPIPYNTLMVLVHRVNNRLESLNLSIQNIGASSYAFGETEVKKKSNVMPVFVEIDGEKILTRDAIKKYGLNYSLVWCRLNTGWSILEAITKPKMMPFGRKVA